jgi:hypothetical protein
MKTNVRILAALVVLLACMVPSSAAAQAWISAPGNGYAEVSFRQISGNAFFDDTGSTRDLPTEFTQQSVGLYAEAGVVERWLQLTAQGELYRRNELALQGATAGLGDIRLGAWSGLLQGEHNLSLGLLVGLPTGDFDPGEGLEDPEQRIIASSLPTGDGNLDVTPTLVYGLGFGGGAWPLRHYFTASLGYMFRTEGLGDSLEWRAELGLQAPYGFLRRAWFVVMVTGLDPVTDTQQMGFSGLADGITYTGLAVGMNIRIWRGLGAMVRAETAVRAANVIAGGPVQAGLFWSF